MKAYLHKLIGTAVLGLALVSNSLPAWAGPRIHASGFRRNHRSSREHGRGAL